MEGPMKKLFFFIALLIMMQAGVYADDNTATIKWTAPTSGTTFSTEVTTGLGTVSSSPTSKNSYFDQVTNKSYPNSSSVTNYFVAYRTGNSSNITDYSSDYMVSFTFTPASTYGFKPTSVLPAIAQESTSEMGIQVEVKQGSKTLVTAEISNLPRIDDSNKNDPYATAINISDAVVSNEAVTVNLKIKLRATVKRLMVNSITLTGTYEQTTSSLVAADSESTWSYTDGTKTWDFSSVSFSDFAGKTEWTADATDPTYYYVNTPITNREFNISGLGGLRFTKGSSDYLQFNKTNTSNPNRFRISSGNSITIPSVEKGATITVYHTNKWYGDGASSVPTLSSNVKLPSADGSQETSITGTYYPATYEVTTAGDVTITAPTDFITIAKIVVTKPTTSTIATTKTTSTSIGTSWDFTATDGKAWAEFKEKANADTVHWTHYTTDNDNYRPAATTDTETEYTPALLSGLIFGNAVAAVYPCPDYTAKYLWMQSASTIKLPQVEAGAVIVITANAAPTAVTGATKVASLSGKYVYQVGTSAADVTFTLPDIQISKIEVVGNTTTITTTKPSTGANKSWTLTGADNSACAAAPAEWVIDDDGATYRPTTQLTSTTYYTVPVIAGLGFTTAGQNLLALDPKNGLWLGANATITIPAVTSGAKVSVTVSGEKTFTFTATSNGTAVDVTDNTFTASADGDVVLTVGTAGHITAISVSTTTTTIATTQTTETAKDADAKWNFTSSNSQYDDALTDAANGVNETDNSKEWSHIDNRSRYQRTLPSTAEEYTIDMLKGLRFNTNKSGGMLFLHDNKSSLGLHTYVAMTIPGVQRKYVILKMNNSSVLFTSVTNAKLLGTSVTDGAATALYEVTELGKDVVFDQRSSSGVTYLTSIEVTNTLPTDDVTFSYADFEFSKKFMRANGTTSDNATASNSTLSRKLKGVSFDFSGDVKLNDEHSFVTVRNGGSVTITAPEGETISQVVLTYNNDLTASGASAYTVAATGDGAEWTAEKSGSSYKLSGTAANAVVITATGDYSNSGVTAFAVSYAGVLPTAKTAPVIAFGSDASDGKLTVEGGKDFWLKSLVKGNNYIDNVGRAWKLTYTSDDTSVLKVSEKTGANEEGLLTPSNATAENKTVKLTVKYVPTDGADGKYFSESNELVYEVTVKPNTSGNRDLEVNKFLYSGQVNSNKNGMDRTFRGVVLKFSGDTNGNSKVVYTSTDKSSITFTNGGTMSLSFDNNLPTAQKGHTGFTKVTFVSTSKLTNSDLTSYLTTAATGWTASVSDDYNLVFSGPATSEPTFTGGTTGITFKKITFDWAGDASWPGGDLEDIKCVPTYSYKTAKVELNTSTDANYGNKTYQQELQRSPSYLDVTVSSAIDADNTKNISVDNPKGYKPTVTANANTTGATLTTTITAPTTNTDYFDFDNATLTASYTIVVKDPDYTSGQEWNFAKSGVNGVPSTAVNGTTSAIGYSDASTAQTFDSGTWSALNASSEYELSEASASASDFADLTINASTKVARTDGLQFSQTAGEQIKVKPGEYLRVNDRDHIKIANVYKGAVILVRAITGNDGVSVGFSEDDQTNLNVLDADHETSVRETDFILKATAQGDVILKPTGDMKIYRIKVYPATAKLYYVNMRANRTSSIKYSTVNEVEGTGANVYYYGYSGFKGLNNNSQKGIVPHMDASSTATMLDPVLWTLQRNGKTTLGDYVKGSTPSDVSGSWETYATNNLVTLSGNTVTSGSTGGVSTIVAKFTPSDESKATITYGFFTVYVNDLHAFRVELGEDLGNYNRGGANKVNRVVWTPSNVADSTSTDVEMLCTLGGWDGATDDARGNGSTMVDAWALGKKDAYLTTVDGYDYAVNARQNSSDEEGRRYITDLSKNAKGSLGKGANETGGTLTLSADGTWSTEETKAGLVAGTPYQMPCRGGFLKFQPRKNGQLTVYIHQNGTVCQDDNDDYTPGGFHMRSYFVADETGHLFSQDASDDDYKLTVTSTATLNKWGNKEDGLLANYAKKAGTTSEEYTNHVDEFNWFKSKKVTLNSVATNADGTPKTTEEVTLGGIESGDKWSAYYQPVLDYNGAQVTIDESQCKYVFNVKAGKTYFMFTGGTSMGFCGFKFVPTENVKTQTVSLPEETKTDELTSLDGFDNSKYSQVSLTRGFTANAWNAVCFPFTMNEEQCQEVFGDGYEILDFDRTTSKTIVFKKHHYQMIVAGRPYLVWTSKSSFTAPTKGYVNFGDALTSPVEVKDLGTNGFVFKGSYNKTTAPQYSYYVTKSGKVKQTTNSNGISLKGYRAWLHSSSVQGAKEFVVSINGVEEMVTGIENVVADLKDPVTNGNVYSLSGVKVSSNGLQNLPAGIYIMNGKKYVVK